MYGNAYICMRAFPARLLLRGIEFPGVRAFMFPETEKKTERLMNCLRTVPF